MGAVGYQRGHDPKHHRSAVVALAEVPAGGTFITLQTRRPARVAAHHSYGVVVTFAEEERVLSPAVVVEKEL